MTELVDGDASAPNIPRGFVVFVPQRSTSFLSSLGLGLTNDGYMGIAISHNTKYQHGATQVSVCPVFLKDHVFYNHQAGVPITICGETAIARYDMVHSVDPKHCTALSEITGTSEQFIAQEAVDTIANEHLATICSANNSRNSVQGNPSVISHGEIRWFDDVPFVYEGKEPARAPLLCLSSQSFIDETGLTLVARVTDRIDTFRGPRDIPAVFAGRFSSIKSNVTQLIPVSKNTRPLPFTFLSGELMQLLATKRAACFFDDMKQRSFREFNIGYWEEVRRLNISLPDVILPHSMHCRHSNYIRGTKRAQSFVSTGAVPK